MSTVPIAGQRDRELAEVDAAIDWDRSDYDPYGVFFLHHYMDAGIGDVLLKVRRFSHGITASMAPNDPIWQSSVNASHNGDRAFGRLYIQGDDVYYFPEIPLKSRADKWVKLSPAILSVVLFAGAALAAYASTTATFAAEAGLLEPAALVGALLGAGLLGVSSRVLRRQALTEPAPPPGLLEDDEYIGMSLDMRFAHSTKAAHFKQADIQSVTGKKTLMVTTKLGDKFVFQTVPHDPELLQQLHGSSSRLPKEELPQQSAAPAKGRNPSLDKH